MEIIRQTSNEIKIGNPSKSEVSNDVVQALLIILFMFGIPAIYLLSISTGTILNVFADFSLTGVIKVDCDRIEPKQVDCQVSKSKSFGFDKGESTTIKFVESASYSSEYIPILTDFAGNYYGKGEFQINSKIDKTKSFKSYQGSANEIVKSVNSFLASQQKSLTYIADDRTNPIILISLVIELIFVILILSLWILFIVIIYQLYLLVLGRFTDYSIILNKSQRSFKYIESKLILSKNIYECKFDDIAKVDVLPYSDSYDIPYGYRPRIIMASGDKHYLSTTSDRQVAIKIANDLNRFMGLPEEEDPVVKQ